MPAQSLQWQVHSTQPSDAFIEAVKKYAPPDVSGHYVAQILWQRGMRDIQQLAGFLNPTLFKPSSPFEFGQEMYRAVQRLQQARLAGEKVAIWGDFDADGVTATAVLWDGLGEFFRRNEQLSYYVPNRLRESHGLNCQGIDVLAESGVKLIVTCDTGSTNLEEVEYAAQLGIDIIVTDHHTLPDDRPPVVAIINPRYLPAGHPMEHLSGVAVAYKLVEALYITLPEVPQKPLEDLLDLVAIGLIADLVQLSGDCRYLAQLGIARLQKQMTEKTRPGVARLLELCKRSGDRPTDISYGLGPRINAVSRIHGDASFCVELLASRDEPRCRQLAEAAELANSRRQSLQKDVFQQVKKRLEQIDLSTTSVIVLVDSQWPVGILGLVASQVVQEYARPTILLSTEQAGETHPDSQSLELQSSIDTNRVSVWESPEISGQSPEETQFLTSPESKNQSLARGSARSMRQIDLYQLVKDRADLLHRFGGHPMAAGLSLPVENIPLFTEAINRQLWQQMGGSAVLGLPIVQADLVVQVAELGQGLFRELKLIEPCGMGNPAPQLLIQNCTFEKTTHRNIQDSKGRKVQYIKTEFEIRDRSASAGFPGVWWGHYKDELPEGECDAVVELDFNTYKNRYEVRLIAVRSCQEEAGLQVAAPPDWIVDWRFERMKTEGGSMSEESFFLLLENCPRSWDELQGWFRSALQRQQKLAIAYPPPKTIPPIQVWQQLVGIAKYLCRTGLLANRRQLCEKLDLGDRALQLGLRSLAEVGFQVLYMGESVRISQPAIAEGSMVDAEKTRAIQIFLDAVCEEQFRRHYFYEVPVSIMQAIANDNSI